MRKTGRIILKILRYTISLVFLALGGIGLAILFANIISLIAPLFPNGSLYVESPIWWFNITLTLVEDTLNTIRTVPLYFYGTIAGSGAAILTGFVLLVQHPAKVFNVLGRGLLRSPGAVFRSPITTYRAVVRWRNWLLAKVEYLQSESAKWKTTFNILKSPYSLLRVCGFSPQMAVGLLFAGSTVGGGVIVNETILAERSFSNGDSGVYDAPLDVPVSYVEGDNTLRIDLGATSVREITIENVSVGAAYTGSSLPSGQQNVVEIAGNVISGGTNTRLEIGHLIFEKSRCKKLELSDIQTHTLIIRGNAADGQSIAPSAGTSRMLAIGGGHHQADAMITSGGLYDRIWVNAPSSGVNGKIGTLRLSNLWTKGGICSLSKINAGTIEIILNEVGYDQNFQTKEFTIATNVTAANIIIEDNVEVLFLEPATQ
jgi:hypothetical protein